MVKQIATGHSVLLPLVFVLCVSKSDGGHETFSPSSVPRTQSDDTISNRVESLLNKLKESRNCFESKRSRNLALRGGELRPSHAKNQSPDIGCGKCIMSAGKCPSCGRSKTVLTPDTLELGSVLGHGSFSTVHIGNSARWGPVAVKKVFVCTYDLRRFRHDTSRLNGG